MIKLHIGESKHVMVRCVNNGCYVHASLGEDGKLYAYKSFPANGPPDDSATHILTRLDEDHYGFRCLASLRWWSSNQDEPRWRHMYANRENRGQWETFQIIDYGSSVVAIQSFTGLYVATELGTGKKDLNANRPEVHDWEQFFIDPIEDEASS